MRVNRHADSSGNTTAQPSADRSGNPNCAFMFKNFPSGNAFLHIKNPIFLDNISELSISLWYMPLDTNVNAGMYQGLVQRDSNRACNLRGQWELGLHDCRKATFSMNNSGLWSDNSLKPCESRNYYTDKWHHIVVTFKNNKAQIFINGVLKGDNTNGIGANCLYRNNIGDLFIGRGFTGVIDDVILYNRELTVAEINQLQQLSPCCE